MAIQDANDLVYETNDKGERVLVKSVHSNVPTYLRFSNTTKRDVTAYWRDFRGKRIRYDRIPPGDYYDVNSFVTHPWEFRDSATDELYYINNKPFFRAPADTGGMNYRTNWNIHIGMRSLRHTVLLSIATTLRNPDDVSELEIPRALQVEVRELMECLQRRNRRRGARRFRESMNGDDS